MLTSGPSSGIDIKGIQLGEAVTDDGESRIVLALSPTCDLSDERTIVVAFPLFLAEVLVDQLRELIGVALERKLT